MHKLSKTVEINNNKKINLLELESLRSELIDKTLNTSSNNLRLYLYQNYFEKILFLNSPNYEEAFLKEFLDDFIDSIKKYDIWGNEPGVAKKLFELINKISRRAFAKEQRIALDIEIKRIELQWIKLTSILNGDDLEDGEIHKAFFPLIDNESPSDFYGTVETVTVRISKAVEVDKFIIVPSEKEIEKRIFEQCKTSWQLALKLSKQYVKKTFKYHEVIISFDQKHGFYEGNSLGIALTLSFLEQILNFYNPTYLIKLVEKSAFTGGVDESGKILNTSEDIIKRKVSAIFLSQINSFVIPKLEETYTYFTLAQLKKNYPNRKLKLIPAEDIDDVLNRRDVVDIRKQKLVVRGGKFVKKNWISAITTVLLAILFAYLFVMDWDHNPASLTTDGNTLFVKNKNGKVIWDKSIRTIQTKFIDQNYLNCLARIIDINSDGMNEVLITNQIIKEELGKDPDDSLRCYSSEGNLIWGYAINDEVYSRREKLSPDYSIRIIDTLTFNGRKSLFLYSSNGPSFSSAVHRIDLKTGTRLPGIFWTSGHIADGIIRDIDNDGKPEMIGLGYDNGYKDVVLFVYEINEENRVRPTIDEYLIKNYPTAQMKVYMRFPKTDYDNYFNQPTPQINFETINYDNYENEYRFNFNRYNNIEASTICFHIKSDFKEVALFIESRFRVLRDSLVAQGRLNLPFTDTEDYKNIIKNNIQYWEDGKWIKQSEIVNQ